jgi:Glycosyltransferase family 87
MNYHSELPFVSRSPASTLLLVLAMRWLSDGKELAAGRALALTSLLRAFPLSLAGYLVVRHKSRVFFYIGFGVVAGLGITVALLGVARSLSFVRLIVPLSEQLNRAGNASLAAFIYHYVLARGPGRESLFTAKSSQYWLGRASVWLIR